jgi:hypothetical protein
MPSDPFPDIDYVAGGSRRRIRTLSPLAAAVMMIAFGAIAVGAVAHQVRRQRAQPPAARTAQAPPGAVPINLGSPTGRPIPSGFLGFSIEYSSIFDYFGTSPTALNPTFIQMIRNLDPGQAPVLRFGGDSTDWSWWPVPKTAEPPGVKITLGPQTAAVLRAMSAALGAKLILGIQFEADSRKVAAYEANELLDGIGSQYVAGLELGNEPEVYGALGWYASKTGAPVLGRPRSYNAKAYLPDFKSIAAALPTTVPLAGPATGSLLYQAAVPKFLASEPRVKIVTLHRYPLRRCSTPASSPVSPTIPHLLERSSSDGLASTLTATASYAHAHGDTLRVDELNSVSCGGDLGVSNTFAATLWSLDTLFAMASAGVDGVNVHTFQGAWYEPFAFADVDGTWETSARPLYYGMLAFAETAPPGSRLLKVVQPPGSTLRMWATQATDGTERVVLINESPTAAETVTVPVPAGATAASVSALAAPSLAATDGVTLGGQSIGPTGAPIGTPQATALAPDGTRFVVPVPAASAAIVTIPPG